VAHASAERKYYLPPRGWEYEKWYKSSSENAKHIETNIATNVENRIGMLALLTREWKEGIYMAPLPCW
jgi:hypothetical protein